ncbi:hypothetical protein NA679_17760, partial [Salmonella sp. NW323]|nr:hypothetical protein [Salmonella enterica]MCQ7731884.1 hypothetical protein [Salmonella enterica]MCQ7736601.1 hypothetical protein [Salmonella enterica]MCQ7740972.1 hypothetical protein [Salmonella enterica]MCQ7776854.1 hypothetical protein [Salmonella enterica]
MPIMNNYRLTFSLYFLRSVMLLSIILTSVGCNNQKSKKLVLPVDSTQFTQLACYYKDINSGNDSNLLIVFYVQIMPDDFVMQLHR